MSNPASPLSEDRAFSKSVSFLPDLWARVEEAAQRSARGNRSEYFRRLVEMDLDGEITAVGRCFRVELGEELAAHVNREAAECFRGDVSAYVASLVARDMKDAERRLEIRRALFARLTQEERDALRLEPLEEAS